MKKSSIGTRMGEKYRLGNVCLFVEYKDYSYRYTWMTSKKSGKKQNMAPVWKKLMKNVDLDEPTSFLDHVHLGCTQRECKSNENIIEENKKCSSHEFLLKQMTILPGWEKLHAKTVARPYDIEDLVKKCVELANKKTEQLYEVSTLCLDDLYLARIVRLDILW